MKSLWLLPCFLAIDTVWSVCVRQPEESLSRASRTPGDSGFSVQVNGNPDRYVPGANYVVSIVGSRNNTYKAFMLTVEASNAHDDSKDLSFDNESPVRVGRFMLYADQMASYHMDCINTVKEKNLNEQTEVQVMWSAPQKGSGCVTFRSMVLTSSESWYADDGKLSVKLCEITPEYLRGEDDSQSESLDCCSCDEAKYKFVFEGLWSNETHPKDFPINRWLTHFSDVIGGTHGKNFSIWDEGQLASDGLRQVAEWGSVGRMDTELRAKAKNLRSLIKAGGLWYPQVNSNTTGTFRVDRNKNLLSLVSMFGPSPDWIVGISGLNLCLNDCSWIPTKTIDLYPYDAGTDSGITYMSPNEPTSPRERIHRITTMYPEDPRSPFYDPYGSPMQPLARVYLTREKVVSKSCADDSDAQIDLPEIDVTENTGDTRRPECNVTEYTDWSPCSVSCGKGIRMRTRQYVMQQKAVMLGCDRQLVSKEMCVAEEPSCSGEGNYQPRGLISTKPVQLEDSEEQIEDNEEICKTSPFSDWSECSTSCGVGIKMRSRRFYDRFGRKKCPHVSLIEKKECVETPCPPPSPGISMDERCTVTDWSDWSPCSVSCGTGLRYRSRRLIVSGDLRDTCAGRVELEQQRICTLQADCNVSPDAAKQICMLEPDVGPCTGYFQRWYFDPREKQCVDFAYGGCRGNRNNFNTEEECTRSCGHLSEQLKEKRRSNNNVQNEVSTNDCVLSEWSSWSACSVSCGAGKSFRMRTVLRPPSDGGKPCPKKLMKRRPCQGPPCREQ